jgi:hypothetical protein
MFVRLTGALYGLPESGKLWYELVSDFMFQIGFDRCVEDPCLFHKESPRGKIIISLDVDDGLYMSTDDSLTQDLIRKLEDRFGKVKHTAGDNLSFLGLNIKKEEDGNIKVSQPAFIADILEGWDRSKTAPTPATKNLLQLDETSPPTEVKPFLSQVMKPKTRPDILFAVSYLASRSSCPTLKDTKAVERVKAYLNNTRDDGLHVNVEEMTLQATVDASHGIHHKDSKGNTGMILSLGSSPIFSRSVKQKYVATSSTHAEIIATYESVAYITGIRQLLEELGYPQRAPSKIQQDNKSSLHIYEKGWSGSNKTRHIRTKYHYIVERMEEGTITPTYTPTDDPRRPSNKATRGQSLQG